MEQEPIPSEYQGWWRIIDTSQWGNNEIDLLGPALISFTGHDDRLRLCALLAYVHCRPNNKSLSFTWRGAWEFDQLEGTGRVTVGTNGRLKGVIKIKNGDESTFAAVRSEEPDEPIPPPPSYQDKWYRRRG